MQKKAVVPPGEDAAAAEDDLTAALRRSRQGDETAFRAVYRALTPELVRYARVIVGEDAEDVVSEAWLQITRDLPGFRGDGSRFRSFAFVVTRNRARDLLRRQGTRTGEVAVPAEQLPEPRDSGADAAEEVLESLSTERALACIATLPRAQAEAVMLRIVLGMDAADASKVLGRRQGAVRMAVSRGLRQLAGLMEQQRQYGADASDVRG